jgi:hypothetical protein
MCVESSTNDALLVRLTLIWRCSVTRVREEGKDGVAAQEALLLQRALNRSAAEAEVVQVSAPWCPTRGLIVTALTARYRSGVKRPGGGS